jgi:hypothetical protein
MWPRKPQEDRRTEIVREEAKPLAPQAEEPPVIARLVIEIRADGTRVLARGAIEDIQTGQRVAVEAKGSTPAEVAASLMKTLVSVPMLARQAVRGLLERPIKRRP